MLPMTINQQRSSKMQAVVQPEVMAIQKKYKNKKDQASMLKQQEEIQQVYDKYGVSMMGGCLPLLIQMPFLFALYPVIYRISDYVPNITAQANKFLTIPDMTITPGNMLSMAKSGETMGYSAAALVITAILLPVLSAFTQYLNMKLSMAVNGSNRPADKDDPTAATMRTMNMTMPLFSLVMVFTLPTGIGIYWIVSAIVRMVQQVFINKHLSKISVDDMIEKNKEKAQKKKEKRGEKQRKSTLWLRQIQRASNLLQHRVLLCLIKKEKKNSKKQEQMRNREVLLQKPTWLRILMRISKGAYIHGLHYCNSKES